MKRIEFPGAARRLAAVALVATTGLALAASLEPPPNLPKEQQANFKTFATRCSQCHTPTRAYAARYVTQKEWETLVGRMARKPNATIPKDDQKKIVAYLTWYSCQKAKKP